MHYGSFAKSIVPVNFMFLSGNYYVFGGMCII